MKGWTVDPVNHLW